MTSCTQPGCTGTIFDGYCDVCGSPAGAAPFVPVEAAAASAALSDSAAPGACRQRGCTGTIVDGYCDICGSPAGAALFVPAAASAVSPATADEPGLTAVLAPTPPSALVEEEEIPTQQIPRVKLPTLVEEEERPTQQLPRVKLPRQQLSTQEIADAQKSGGEKQLAEDPNDAQCYRTRVEEAQLPGDVRDAALREVDKLERASDQSPDSADIRTWLDTILELPWGTKTADWIDIQGSREAEATLRKLIEPAVADVEEGDTAEVGLVVADVEEGDTAEVGVVVADVEEGDTAEVGVVVADVEEGDTAEVGVVVADVEEGDTAEVGVVVADVEEGDTAEVGAVVADTEKAERAPVGPHDDDTVDTPAVLAVLSESRHPNPQLPQQPVPGTEPVQTAGQKRRSRSLALAAMALIGLMIIGALFLGASRDGRVTAESNPTLAATATATVSKPTSEPSNESADIGEEESTIQLEDLAESARPFEAVPIQGTYRGGTGTFLRVQRWDGDKWLDFPVPTRTDQSGQFITQAEFAQPGRYRLRVVDPDTGVTSKPFVVVIKG